MRSFYWVEHDDWDEPRKVYIGPNTNSRTMGFGRIDTIGSSPHCRWPIPDPSLPDIVAFIEHFRYRRIYVCELNPEDYGSQTREDFLKRKPVLHKVLTGFDVAGYRFVSRHEDFSESNASQTDPLDNFSRLRAAYIKTWDGHMSPGDWEGYERDLAAHEAWRNGEDIWDIIRRERESGKT